MTSKPHIAFGLFAGAVITGFCQMSDPSFTSDITSISAASVGVLLGSLAPDLDAPSAPIGKLLFFIAQPIQQRWPHRTLLHSMLGAGIASGIVYYITNFLSVFLPIPGNMSFLLCVFFWGGHLGHLIVDSLTITGTKFLFPYQRAFAYPSSPQHRVRTGDKKEKYYTLFFLIVFLSYLPVLKAGGASRAIHRTFKSFRMARQDYLTAVNIETFLKFKGSFRHDRTSVAGESLILDAEDGHFVIYFNNSVLTIGDQALILGTEYVCEYTNTTPQISEFSVVNQPVDSILAQVPADVLMSGELVSDKKFQTSAPVYTANDFPTIKLTSGSITFSYATKREALLLNVRIPEDVRKLQSLVRTLQSDIDSIGTQIDSLMEKRSAEKKLIVRHNLRKQVGDLKSEKKALQKSVENKQRQLQEFGKMEIQFSGKLSLRKMPSLARSRGY